MPMILINGYYLFAVLYIGRIRPSLRKRLKSLKKPVKNAQSPAEFEMQDGLSADGKS